MAFELDANEIIQIVPPHKWGGCLAVVSEPRPWGCNCYVSVPRKDEASPGQAFIQLKWQDFKRLGVSTLFEPKKKALLSLD